MNSAEEKRDIFSGVASYDAYSTKYRRMLGDIYPMIRGRASLRPGIAYLWSTLPSGSLGARYALEAIGRIVTTHDEEVNGYKRCGRWSARPTARGDTFGHVVRQGLAGVGG